MHKIALLLATLAFAPAPAPNVDITTKIPLKGVEIVMQKQLSPLLTSKQLAGIGGKLIYKKSGEPVLDQVIEVGMQGMRSGDVVLSLLCVDYVTGEGDGFAGWTRPIAPNCQASMAGAVVTFPATAGRVYVVNCQTNGGKWKLARWDGTKMTGSVESSIAASPSLAVAATATKTESVAFAPDWSDSGSGFGIGKCQVGRLAI